MRRRPWSPSGATCFSLIRAFRWREGFDRRELGSPLLWKENSSATCVSSSWQADTGTPVGRRVAENCKSARAAVRRRASRQRRPFGASPRSRAGYLGQVSIRSSRKYSAGATHPRSGKGHRKPAQVHALRRHTLARGDAGGRHRLQQAVEAEARVAPRLAHTRGSSQLQDHAAWIVELIKFDIFGPRTSSYIVFLQKQTILRQLVQAWGSSQVAG